MPEERREHQRFAHPFEGTWTGASGASPCRIADISVGGCFVQSMATPAVGEDTTVMVRIGDHVFTFHGVVIYGDQGMGFAVRFKDIPDEELQELTRLLESLKRGQASA